MVMLRSDTILPIAALPIAAIAPPLPAVAWLFRKRARLPNKRLPGESEIAPPVGALLPLNSVLVMPMLAMMRVLTPMPPPLVGAVLFCT